MKKLNERTIFSQNLIRLRKEKGLSQIELANLSGLSRRVIAHYETKKVNPPLENLQALAKALNADISDLIGTNEIHEHQSILSDLDPRTLKKIELLLSLPKLQRHLIYSMIDNFAHKTKSA